MKKFLNRKLTSVVLAGVMGVSLTIAPAPQPAEAFGVLSAIGAIIGVSAQQAALNQQISYYNGKGRNKLFEEIKKKEGVNGDERANAMLADAMTRLSATAAKVDPTIKTQPFNYFVNNKTTFNAYCTLGHNMSVNIGLFNKLNYNEDELAFVVGHEMGHGVHHDPESGVKKQFPLELLAAVVGSQVGTAGAVGANILANLGSAKLITLPMEKKADVFAFSVATDSGYNPGAGAALWQRILETAKSGDKQSFAGSVINPSDHPTNEGRRDKYLESLNKYSNNKVSVNIATGAVAINKHTVGTPAAISSMSAKERACLVAGNLARVYHNKLVSQPTAALRGDTLYLNETDIMTITANDNGSAWVTNINAAQSKKATKVKEKAEKESKKESSKEKKSEDKKETAKEKQVSKNTTEKLETKKTTSTGTFREKVEAAKKAKEAEKAEAADTAE